MEESLELFRKMRDGAFKPQEAMLRMKQDILGNGNPQMWDLTAYRVLDSEHHRTGGQWKIYPTYDFTHCLCDSFENISWVFCNFMMSGVSEANPEGLGTRFARPSSSILGSPTTGSATPWRFTGRSRESTAVST